MDGLSHLKLVAAWVQRTVGWLCLMAGAALGMGLGWAPAAAQSPGQDAVAPVSATAVPPGASAARIEAFVRDGCLHCTQAKAFLAELQQEQPTLQVVVHDLSRDPAALARLQALVQAHGGGPPRVPAVWVAGQLIVGYSATARTDRLIRRALAGQALTPAETGAGAEGLAGSTADADSCAASDGNLSCKLEAPAPEPLELELLGRTVSFEALGLPLFALAMGFLSGFSPCALWVLLLLVSVLAPLHDRRRMLAVAGTFVAVEGLSYFVLMTAWLNLFLLLGLSRLSQWGVAAFALVGGLINVKDFFAPGQGPTLSMPARARPGIYERLRGLLHAPSLRAAVAGAAVLALLVQSVDLLCTSGFLALFTRVLTLQKLDTAANLAVMALYMGGYLAVHMGVLGAGVALLSRQRLQERQGRWLKLMSGAVMLGLSLYLVLAQTQA